MSNYIIRTANHNDIIRIGRVLAATWKKAYAECVSEAFLEKLTDAHWRAFLSQGFAEDKIIVYVAEKDVQMIGVAVCRASEMESYPNDLEVVSLYVLPKFQNKGVGTALFSCLFDHALKHYNGACVLDVIEKNTSAVAFYQRRGFSIVGSPFEVALDQSAVRCVIMRKTH